MLYSHFPAGLLHVFLSSSFLLFCGPEDLGKRLRENGILVRDCANYAGLGPGWYRAGLRTPEENGRLIAALSTLLRGE